jgi:hypothetical protein
VEQLVGLGAVPVDSLGGQRQSKAAGMAPAHCISPSRRKPFGEHARRCAIPLVDSDGGAVLMFASSHLGLARKRTSKTVPECLPRHHNSKRQNFTSIARFLTRHAGIPHLSTGDSSILKLWKITTVNCKYGRRIVRKISKTVPHWWVRRSLGSKATISMLSSSTSRPSTRHTQTDLSIMKESPASSERRPDAEP